jgi:hypothetical protein
MQKPWPSCLSNIHTPTQNLQTTKKYFFTNTFFCFFFASSLLFTFHQNKLAPHHKRFASTALNDERRVTISFLPPFPFLTYDGLSFVLLLLFFLNNQTGWQQI